MIGLQFRSLGLGAEEYFVLGPLVRGMVLRRVFLAGRSSSVGACTVGMSLGRSAQGNSASLAAGVSLLDFSDLNFTGSVPGMRLQAGTSTATLLDAPCYVPILGPGPMYVIVGVNGGAGTYDILVGIGVDLEREVVQPVAFGTQGEFAGDGDVLRALRAAAVRSRGQPVAV